MKKRAAKLQTGSVIVRSSCFYIRFYENGKRVTKPLTTEVGHPLRVDKKFTVSFNAKSKRYRYSRAVMREVKRYMEPLNRAVETGRQMSSAILIPDFWKRYIADVGPTLRACTLNGYKRVYRLYLEDEFKGRALSNWSVPDGSGVLTRLAKRGLGSSSISHVRSLGSAIFKYAVNLGLIEKNPWHEVMIVAAKVKDNEPTRAYTIGEVKAIRAALASRLDAQCIVDLAFCSGLRPSEIAGLRVEHLRDGRVYVEQGVVDGVVGKPKTVKSKRDVAIIEPLRSELAAWVEQCGSPTEGWLFPNSKGGPLNMDAILTGVIRPMLKAAGVPFFGLYGLRRAHGTVLTRATRSLTAARQTLGHSSEQVTGRNYSLPDTVAGDAGLLEMEKLLVGEVTGTASVN
jgi:integrase